jgi:hypothetical protein
MLPRRDDIPPRLVQAAVHGRLCALSIDSTPDLSLHSSLRLPNAIGGLALCDLHPLSGIEG